MTPRVLFDIFQGVEATCQGPLVVLFYIFQGMKVTCQHPLVVLFHIFRVWRRPVSAFW